MANYNLIVIKIGSSTLTTSEGKLDHGNLKRIVAETSSLIEQGKKLVIVTSGAIITGLEKLNLGQPRSIPEKQAAAAVGQSRLMRQYEKAFEGFGITVAQILLTSDVVTNRKRRENSRHCLQTLLAEKVVPIVNENDSVSIDEIKFGDNDNLAALTAQMIGADLLCLLTDVDGFYMNDDHGNSAIVPEINKLTASVRKAAGNPTTKVGTGGMVTKLQAAEICFKSGIDMAIVSGRRKNAVNAVVNGEKVGTLFRKT
ncbi:MAG: glutamate 5-kinase [Candidatus Margulisbacteria bacterium]|nr:glutamate 5-kinase [Candidatus Margulisiibacteriota bacterium]MBU1617198.1 glutamate 5-kinase [Candidatus Margulisiibacteriota bacterium]